MPTVNRTPSRRRELRLPASSRLCRLVVGGVSLVTGVGAIADVSFTIGNVEATAEGLGVASASTGATGSAIDTAKCIAHPSLIGCGAAIAGAGATGLGTVAVLKSTGALATIFGAQGLSSGGLAIALDICDSLHDF